MFRLFTKPVAATGISYTAEGIVAFYTIKYFSAKTPVTKSPRNYIAVDQTKLIVSPVLDFNLKKPI